MKEGEIRGAYGGGAGGAYANRGENPGGKRGAAAEEEEELAVTSLCAGWKRSPASSSSPPLAPDAGEKTLEWCKNTPIRGVVKWRSQRV